MAIHIRTYSPQLLLLLYQSMSGTSPCVLHFILLNLRSDSFVRAMEYILFVSEIEQIEWSSSMHVPRATTHRHAHVPLTRVSVESRLRRIMNYRSNNMFDVLVSSIILQALFGDYAIRDQELNSRPIKL